MLTSRSVPHIFLIVLLVVLASGCQVVGGIFKAGFWTAIVLVAIIAVGLMLVVSKMKG